MCAPYVGNKFAILLTTVASKWIGKQANDPCMHSWKTSSVRAFLMKLLYILRFIVRPIVGAICYLLSSAIVCHATKCNVIRKHLLWIEHDRWPCLSLSRAHTLVLRRTWFSKSSQLPFAPITCYLVIFSFCSSIFYIVFGSMRIVYNMWT